MQYNWITIHAGVPVLRGFAPYLTDEDDRTDEAIGVGSAPQVYLYRSLIYKIKIFAPSRIGNPGNRGLEPMGEVLAEGVVEFAKRGVHALSRLGFGDEIFVRHGGTSFAYCRSFAGARRTDPR